MWLPQRYYRSQVEMAKREGHAIGRQDMQHEVEALQVCVVCTPANIMMHSNHVRLLCVQAGLHADCLYAPSTGLTILK